MQNLGVNRTKLKYVQSMTDRLGCVRHYFRHPRLRTTLPGAFGSIEFMHAYNRALLEASERAGPKPLLQDRKIERPGVYLLMKGPEIIYVGTSSNMGARIASHRANGRDFEKAFYIEARDDEREILEDVLIRKIRPKQNTSKVGKSRSTKRTKQNASVQPG